MVKPEVLLDNFNARDMTASECVTTFVDLMSFQRLRGASNTLLIGPRGSGKTTLLKLLTPEGIEKWMNIAGDGGMRIGFTGVHVPLDVQMSDLFERIKKSNISIGIVENGIESIFSLHVFRCVANSIAWLCGSSKDHSIQHVLDGSDESRLIHELAHIWSIQIEVPTVAELKFQLRLAQIRLVELWGKVIVRDGELGDIENELSQIISLDVRLKASLESISSHFDWLPKRWCVLFDEVELAPNELQTKILSYLRHSDEDIFFKIAISPYMFGFRGLHEVAVASAGNDYVAVDLLSQSTDDIREFSSRFFTSAASRAGFGELNLQESLGASTLNPVSGSHGFSRAYSPDSSQVKAFASLAKKDLSFATYLGATLKVEDLARSTESDERGPFRKARQVALLRNAFLSERETSGRITKTKNDSRRLFTGAETIVRMCEGNPRRLAFMVPLLLSNVDSNGKISRTTQITAVRKTEAAFRSFLRGLPVSPSLGELLNRGILSFVDMVGDNYHKNIVGPEFDDDPVAAFTVHSSATSLVEELIARCVNSGALVQLSDLDQGGITAVQDQTGYMITSKGKRFRLTYILSPGLGLMTRIGRANSLETLLTEWITSGTSHERILAKELLNRQLRLV